MRLLRILSLGLIIAIFIVSLSCGGGGGKNSTLPKLSPSTNSDSSGEQQDDGINDSTEIDSFSDYFREAPRTKIDSSYVLVKTGDTVDEFKGVVSKFGYEVQSKTGNWIKIRVPDGNIERAITELRKEYTVINVEPVYKYVMPKPTASPARSHATSFLPSDPFYADRVIGPNSNFQTDANGNPLYSTYWGQRVYMAPMGFEGAWDIALLPTVRTQPVVVAIIGAGISPDQFDVDTARIVALASGTIAADGTFTQGSYNWDVDANQNPYDPWGGRMAGLFLSQMNNISQFTYTTQDPPATWEWQAGMTPLTPTAQVIIIKTGELQGTNWVFTSEHIANSINHAVNNGADIIVIATWAVGPVPQNVQDAVNNARNNDALVIAPAGESTLNDNGTPDDISDDFWNPTVDVSTITPAAANGVISVGGTGFEQIDFAPSGDPPTEPPPGYANRLIPNIGDPWWRLTDFSNTGVDIAAVGWGLSWEDQVFFGYFSSFGPSLANLGTGYAAGYVAGAAAILHQALSNVNGGTPPADVDQVIEDLLYSTADNDIFNPAGVQSGFLQAGLAASLANNGGFDQVIQPVDITNVQIGGGFFVDNTAFIETNQEVQFSVSMTSSAGGYELAIGWGDGTTTPSDGNPAPYNPGDPISHTYTTAGSYVIYFLAEDADGFSDVFAVYGEVYDGISVSPTILFPDSQTVVPGTPQRLTYSDVYLADARAVYTTITDNIITCEWDFNYTGNPSEFSPEISGEELFRVLFTYSSPPPTPSPGILYLDLGKNEDYNIALRITQTKRPTEFPIITVQIRE